MEDEDEEVDDDWMKDDVHDGVLGGKEVRECFFRGMLHRTCAAVFCQTKSGRAMRAPQPVRNTAPPRARSRCYTAHTTPQHQPSHTPAKERDAPVIVDIETHVLFPMAVKNTKTHLVCVAGVPPRNRDQVRRRRRDRGQRHGCSGHSHTTGVGFFFTFSICCSPCA